MSILVPQLGHGSTYPGNCGPASVAEALRWATDHDVAPTPDEVRREMRDLVGGTQMSDHAKGYNAFIEEASRKGWELTPMRYWGVALFGSLHSSIRRGRGATVAIRYDLLPERFRCATFAGNHSIFISDVRKIRGILHYRVWDPLADGRRAGIPRGPIWYPEDVLKRAAEGCAGKNHAMFNTVKRGKMDQVDPLHPMPDAVAIAGTIIE